MKKLLKLVVTALILTSCKSKLSHREHINQDSTGQRKVLKVYPPDTTYGFIIDTARFVHIDWDSVTWTFGEVVLQTDSFRTYRQNGKWTVENPPASMEMLWQWNLRLDSMRMKPFVVIHERDTLKFYHGDTIRVGPDHNFQQINYPSPSPIPDTAKPINNKP